MWKAPMLAARHLLRQSVAVRSWPLWSLQPPWLVAFVLVVITTDLTAIGVAASFTAITGSNLALFGLLLGCTVASVELSRKAGEQQGGITKDVQGVWELPAAVLLPPLYVLIVPIIRIALLQWRIGRAPVYRRVFSAAAISLSYGAASVT
ncbi:MAG TPA: GGDEF domain-containing protein, partial [Streptosporangiaceae bacterium]|nr:GGDEF domain-containing protein [Streptosporangiaceae bacterium]